MTELSPGVRRNWEEAKEICKLSPAFARAGAREQQSSIEDLARILALGEQRLTLSRCFKTDFKSKNDPKSEPRS